MIRRGIFKQDRPERMKRMKKFNSLFFRALVLAALTGGGTSVISPPAAAEKKSKSRQRMEQALRLMEKGEFLEGSKKLYRLSRRKTFQNQKAQIKYTLGIAFAQLRLYHLSALQLIAVIKSQDRRYTRKAAEKLTELASFLGNEDFVYYILTKVKLRDFPVKQKQKLYFYYGLLEFKKKRYPRSRAYFARVRRQSVFYNKALYKTALSYAEEGRPLKAAEGFNRLAASRSGITDTTRVAAKMGEARSLYQAGKFEHSLRVYRSIPRDSLYWHDALLESAWAYLRAARFRSALSVFQTLHSAFYEGFYQPESLLLRAYVYLYICKYYEMEKSMDFFNAVYKPLLTKVNSHLNRRGSGAFLSQRTGGSSFSPASIARKRLEKKSEYRSAQTALAKLRRERSVLRSLPHHWIVSSAGRSGNAVISARIATMKKRSARISRAVLEDIQKELSRLSEMEQFLRYDMLRGKREFVKKKIQKKYADEIQIDENINRDYFVKNGYEYWPFKGENWLDELGNYHYIGLQSCR